MHDILNGLTKLHTCICIKNNKNFITADIGNPYMTGICVVFVGVYMYIRVYKCLAHIICDLLFTHFFYFTTLITFVLLFLLLFFVCVCVFVFLFVCFVFLFVLFFFVWFFLENYRYVICYLLSKSGRISKQYRASDLVFVMNDIQPYK
jgi:hypothetical protein